MVVALNINVYWSELRKLAALNSQSFFFHWTSDSEAMLRQEWLFSVTYAWFGFIQMWVWFENYRLTCIYRKKLFTLFQIIWETNVIVQAKAHWNTQHRLNIVAVLSHFSHVQLCDPLDYCPPGSLVHGLLQARILEWVAMPSSTGIFLIQRLNPCLLCLPALTSRFFPLKMEATIVSELN